MKTDMRITKTKLDLKNALISLLEKNTFDKITVLMICDKAMVHRVTFYAHYKDKFDLSHDIVNDIIEKVMAKSSVSNGDFSDFQKVFDYCMNLIENAIGECFANKNILCAISSQENSILSFLINTMIEKSLIELGGQIAKIRPLKYNIDFICSFICGGYCKVVLDWLFNDKGVSKEQFVKSLQAVLANSFNSNILFDN